MIDVNRYRAVLAHAGSLDMGDWSTESVDRAVRGSFASPFDAGQREVAHSDCNVVVRVDGVIAEQATLDDLAACLRATEDHFGVSAQVIGGYSDGTVFHWWRESRKTSSFRWGRRSRGGSSAVIYAVEYCDGTVRIAVHPAERFEREVATMGEYGDGPFDAPLCPAWTGVRARTGDKLSGMLSPGMRFVTDWADLTEALERSVVVLSRTLVVLRDGMSVVFAPEGHPERFVRFLIDDEDGFLFAEAARGWGGPDDSVLADLGWQLSDDQPADDQPTMRSIHIDPVADAGTIAHLIASTLKTFGARLPQNEDDPDIVLCQTNYVSAGPFDGCRFTIYGLHVIEVA
ncbi:hypothetical protein EF294_19985 [Gordonia oryzae]|uniref:Uncharacterized protein n=2 Tax=Gordonia oryzae TaxID=2487349 RepID=A0A3N4G236_9ACTN|nr:hypothetical protein EF294_19985 [Gordonia oryzae]